jgi:hypothetical protein
MGAGSVGGQTIMGIPAVKRLVDDLNGKALVWPFQSGWRALTPADVADKEAVIAEIYPALVAAKPDPGEAPDRAQVRALCDHFAKLDDAGKLGQAFAPPKRLTPEVMETVEREEGWILGAGA